MAMGTRGPLARLWDDGPVAGMTDGQLLDRFSLRAGDAGEAAFAALVQRHGPMVARVCRTQLRAEHDVEDAFQATFLVLVRRAGSIGERDLLAPWLYGVAHRVARKARTLAAKRRDREGGPADVDPPARSDGSAGVQVELAPVLHEEVDRLPAKYRQPVILCHLQGLTHAEAAHELAWPVGTVSVRLARARKILADRLTRRGVTASITAVAATLTAEASATALAPSWTHAATVVALAAASGLSLTAATATISVGAVSLARRTSMTMALSPLKWLSVSLPLAAFLGSAVGVVATLKMSVGPAAPPALAQALTPTAPMAPAPSKSLPEEADGVPPSPTGGRNPFGIKAPTGEPADPPTRANAGDSNSADEMPAEEPTGPPVRQSEVDDGSDAPLDAGIPIPPGYFDLPVSNRNDGTDPPILKPGQILVVEVLEALPGRPIGGTRIIRPDGTISLGFYGDLAVAGLNRDQIKVKLLRHLRRFLSDQVLGLSGYHSGRKVIIDPIKSARVFIDESQNFEHQPTPVPTTRTGRFDPATEELQTQVKTLHAKVDQLLGTRPRPDQPEVPIRDGRPAPVAPQPPPTDAPKPEPAPAPAAAPAAPSA